MSKKHQKLIKFVHSSLQELPTFSLSNITNVYTAYAYGGYKHASILSGTILMENILSKQYGLTKDYITLSSFWGYICWNAIMQIYSSDKISSKYKIPLSLLPFAVSSAMVYLSPDKTSQSETIKTLDSIILIASFFDEDGAISKLEEKFDESYITGPIHTITHIKELLSNKFILCSLAYQFINLGKLALVQKLFFGTPTGKVAAFLAIKEDNPFNYLIKNSALNFASNIVNITHAKITDNLKHNIEQDITKKIVQLVLQDSNTEVVMRNDSQIANLCPQILNIFNDITVKIGSILESITISTIFSQQGNQLSILESHPLLLLLDILVNRLFDYTLIEQVKNFIDYKLYGPPSHDDNGLGDHIEMESKKVGNFNIAFKQTPLSYTYSNIQNIAKLGGNIFMLNKSLNFIEVDQPTRNLPENSTVLILNLFKNTLTELLYAWIFSSSEITQEKLFSIENDLNTLNSTIEFLKHNSLIGINTDPESIKLILETLNSPPSNKLQRKLNDSMKLTLNNYQLKKVEAGKEDVIILNIDHLEFNPGCIYAITGTIGTGKTTLINDIAKCLPSSFLSSGDMYYPRYEGHEARKIFCGTTTFSPPATTLLERLTYRIPTEYTKMHHAELLDQSLELFKKFGQTDFTEEKLNTKINNTKLSLSTGQEKLTLVIGAILYKKYLGDEEQGVLILDETLANLDEETTKLVCNEIKKEFKNSIIISVDHNAKNNTEFYDKFINLIDYKPDYNSIFEPEIVGNDE